MKWFYWTFLVTINLGLVNLVPQNITSYPCTDHNHMFLVPGVLTAGGSSRACVSRFHHSGPVRMTLTLYTKQAPVSAVREMAGGDGGCIDISVPLLPNTKADLVINLSYPEAKCTWKRRVSVRILGGRVVVVLTERARLRAGDLLRARVLLLRADLTPDHGSQAIDEMWLESPRSAWTGARVAEWRNVRTRFGVGQIQHKLDEYAATGVWTVRVKLADGSQGAAAFQVGEYELPPFQLSVRHAPKVLSTSNRLVWTVCVRYPWTEAVEGMLVIRIRGEGPSSSAGIRTAVRLRSPRACHRHAAAAKRVGVDGANSPDVVVADFSFQEESTKIWQNTTVVSQVIHKHVSLEFLTKYRAVISPWLPYKLKVKATRWDEKPAPNEVVKVCRTSATSDRDEEYTASEGTCTEGISDNNGVVRVMFNAERGRNLFYRFHATIKNDSTISSAPLYLPTQQHGSIHAALGPLKSDSQDLRTFVPLYLSLRDEEITHALTVHFVVITRGGTIFRWGATTQCPIRSSSEQIRTAARNSSCSDNDITIYKTKDRANDYRVDTLVRGNQEKTDQYTKQQEKDDKLMTHEVHNHLKRHENTNETEGTNSSPEANELNTDQNVSKDNSNKNNEKMYNPDLIQDKEILRIMLPVKVSHQMCPDSHLIAYFHYNGMVVSASKRFEMEECFVNKVEASFPSRQAAPGSTTTLHLSTPGPALCALTALDSAAKWVQPGPTVKDVILVGLKRMVEGHRNLTEYDAAEDCFLTSDSPSVPSSSLELTASWLARAGVRMVGGDRRPSKCTKGPEPLLAEDITIPRTDFSEAWLWRLVPIGQNGTASVEAKAPDSITRYEASAVCIARNGIAVSQPTVLQVFREFFIHADCPRRLRRGDSSIVRYRIFNYLYEDISIKIQILTDPHLGGPTHYVETACVHARSSIAHRIVITAKLPGSARVSVRAKSVRDGLCGTYTTGKAGVSDEVIIELTVDPEGIPVQEDKSILLCGQGSSEESNVKEVAWKWDAVHAVPGTQSLRVWATADLAQPMAADADELVVLPRGCGEQNLARMATNLLALTHLDPTSTAYATAREHVNRGFSRQFQYVHPAGGFSAFGASDPTPSTWLTAFALRYMKKTHQILTPSEPPPAALGRAEQWLLNQQMENGCFRNEGQVFHRELRGGLNEEGEIASVALTAYVITSLIENSVLSSRIIANALSCLRALPPLKNKKNNTPNRIYAHSLLAYTFMNLKRYEKEIRRANEASLHNKEVGGLEVDEEIRQLEDLLKMAKRDGDLVWWETGSLATSIEATSYALLALSSRRLFSHDARAAIRWLSTHRSASGGFVATQDTLIALEALTSWSPSKPQTMTKLNVTAWNDKMTTTVTIMPGVKVPEVINMGDMDSLKVRVEDSGCALIQASRSYNTYSVKSDQSQNKKLEVQVIIHTDGAFDCGDNNTSCYCAAIVQTCVIWTGIFPEMALLEVSLPGGYGADASLLYSQMQQPHSLLRRIELSPTRITYYLSNSENNRVGYQCWKAHTVGPKTKTQPGYVTVKSYYEPEINDTQIYTIPKECPAGIYNEQSEYVPKDNLFVKARSASYTDEIFTASQDIFSEDIADSAVLDDPLYESMTTYSTDQETYKKGQTENSKTTNEKGQESNKKAKTKNIKQEYIKKNKDVHSDSIQSPSVLFNDHFNFTNLDSTSEDSKSYENPKSNFDESSITNRNSSNRNIPDKESIELLTDFLINSNFGGFSTNDDSGSAGQTADAGKVKVKGDTDTVITENKEEIIQGDIKSKTNMGVFTDIQKSDVSRNGKFFADDETSQNENDHHDQPIEIEINSHLANEIGKTFIEDINLTHSQVNQEQDTHSVDNEEYKLLKQKIREELLEDNPNFSSFHMIDTLTDLEVPAGIEGPVPAIVLPPPDMARHNTQSSPDKKLSQLPPNYRRPIPPSDQNQRIRLPSIDDQEHVNLELKNNLQPVHVVYPDRHKTETFHNSRHPSTHLYHNHEHNHYQTTPKNLFHQNQLPDKNTVHDLLNLHRGPNIPQLVPDQKHTLESQSNGANQEGVYFYQPVAPDTYSRDIRSRKKPESP